MRYTLSVLWYRFCSIFVLGAEVCAVSSIALAAPANMVSQEATETPMEEPVRERREVRLVVVSAAGEVAEPAEAVPPGVVEEDDEVEAAPAKPAPQEPTAEPAVVTAPPPKAAAQPDPQPTPSVSIVPFYSQFADISEVSWQKVSCGIASVAMLIDHYSDEPVDPDALLAKGRAAGSFLPDAGWIHAGLIALGKPYGLEGESISLAGKSRADALAALERVLKGGPVMASVHYTFEPTNPIPHLVVVTGITDGKVFYNDPAETAGNGSISVEKFQRAWKQRYIIIRPE